MEKSPELHELATALALAQAEMSNPSFDATNPHFKSKFASLASVRAAVLPTLNKHGLSVAQFPCSEGGNTGCTSILMHGSGQFILESVFIPVSKQDAHGAGSALTYARRYALQAIAGVVADDDDDGNEAVKLKPEHENIDRTKVMKFSNAISDASVHDKELGVLENWDAATEIGVDFVSAVWHNLTTPVRDHIRRLQNERKERNGGETAARHERGPVQERPQGTAQPSGLQGKRAN